jgi:hypothetical protein
MKLPRRLVLRITSAVAIGLLMPSCAFKRTRDLDVSVTGGSAVVEPPTYHEVVGALLATAYWRSHDRGTADATAKMVVAPAVATDILARDQNFGANTRRWYAYVFLKDRYPAEAQKIQKLLKANNCAPKVECKLRYAASDAQAALRFQFQIKMNLNKGAAVFDPQNWDELEGSYFTLVGRRNDSTCPAPNTAPPPKDLLSVDVGQTWKDTVYERFDVPQRDIHFQHVLFFDSYRPKKNLYCLGYRVCPGLRYPNKLWEADRHLDSGMSEDDGCSWIIKNGPDIQVNAIKRLTISPELCKNPPHDCNPDLMGLGLEMLAIETSIAFARVAGGESEACQPASCDPVTDVDIFACKSSELNMPPECDIETRVHSFEMSK